MKIGINISLIFFLLPCFMVKAQHARQGKSQLTQAQAIAEINALPEIKAYLYAARKDKPLVVLQRVPESSNKYYWISDGISNGDMFRKTDDYFVDPYTGEVFINDAMDNSTDDLWHIISLKQYRYWRNDPRFQHYHTFKGNKIVVLDENGGIIHGTK